MTNLAFDSILRVDEVVTDVLTMDLLHSSPLFLRKVLEVAQEDPSSLISSIRRSVSDTSLGETDIELVTDGPSGKCGILIENKIRAPLMPRQFARYRRRGEVGIEKQYWKRFRVLLLSPRGYFEALGLEHAQHIDGQLSYEEVVDFLADHSEFGFKRHVFQSAIADFRKGYSKLADAAMMDFYQNYWRIASADFPQLQMPKPGIVGKDGSWIYFPPLYNGLSVRLIHKFKSIGCELSIPTGNAALVEEQLAPVLEPDMSLRFSKTVAFLNIKTPPIDHLAAFETVKADVVLSLQQLDRLRVFALNSDVRRRITSALGQ